MTSLNNLLTKWPRVIIFYPVYLGISDELESKWYLVKNVRENPKKYPAPYISYRGLCGIRGPNDEQIVELFTELNGKHVEVMTKIYRKRPCYWFKEEKEFEGHLLASLPDCPFDIENESIYQLCENFLDCKIG